MLRAELIRTCSHEKVAHAALRSIGGDFCVRIEMLARARGVSAGAFAAERVRRFAEEACEASWEALGRATRGADAPILVGLRWIVERSLGDESDDGEGVRSCRLPRRVVSGFEARA